jgi:hypothetical protein
MMQERDNGAHSTATPQRATRNLVGRILLGVVGVFTAISPYAADWNKTHIYNPYWPPHAKFHNAQTMIFGAVAGTLALLLAAWPRPTRHRLWGSALMGGIYWLTQMPAILFPGTAFTDPQFLGLAPVTVGGHAITQVHLDLVILALVVLGVWLATKNSSAR